MSTESKRFEVKLPPERRAQLDALAREVRVHSATLARLAIVQMFDQRAVSLPAQREGVAA